MSLRRALLWSAVALLPCVLLAGLSAVLPAPPATLAEASAAARAAGVPASVPLTPELVDHDSVSRLRHGLLENIRDYYATTTAARVLGTTLLWAGLFAGLVSVVWLQLGRSLRDRTLHVLLVVFGSAAVALSVAAIDYRRWWALATVTALALMLELTRSRPAPSVGLPQYASSRPAVPDLTGQNQTALDQSALDQTVLDQTARDQTVLDQTMPEAAASGAIAPDQVVPDQSVPGPRPGRACTVLLIVLTLAGVLLQSTPVWPLQLADLPLLGTVFG